MSATNNTAANNAAEPTATEKSAVAAMASIYIKPLLKNLIVIGACVGAGIYINKLQSKKTAKSGATSLSA